MEVLYLARISIEASMFSNGRKVSLYRCGKPENHYWKMGCILLSDWVILTTNKQQIGLDFILIVKVRGVRLLN